MINRKELAICKQRGHDPQGHREKWERCKRCGMWTRTISTKEEREDEPPESEQDPMYQLQRQIRQLQQLGAKQHELEARHAEEKRKSSGKKKKGRHAK